MEKASLKNQFHYNTKLKKYASENRKTMTKSEASLWKYVLSSKIMMGYKFNRQRPVLNYIADFMCKELLLIIEIDGNSHDDEKQINYDKQRDEELRAVGFTTLRFSDWEVLNRINDVSQMIMKWVDDWEEKNL